MFIFRLTLRTERLSILGLLVLSMASSPALAPVLRGENVQTHEGTVVSSKLNVRIRPGLDKPDTVVATLKKGDKVKILGKSGNWYEIAAPENSSVWIGASSIEGDTVVKETPLRSGPGIEYSSYSGSAKKGQKVEVLQKSGGNWVRIKPLESLSAWISADFVMAEGADKIPDKPGAQAAPASESEKKADGAEAKASAKADDLPFDDRPMKNVTQDGFLVPVESGVESVSYALAMKSNGVFAPVCYVRSSKLNLKLWENQKIQVSGKERWIRGWKRPLIEVDTVTPLW